MNLTFADIWKQLKSRFQKGGIVTRLVFINVGVYLLMQLVGVMLTLFANAPDALVRFFALPADLNHLLHQPWTVLTYAFVHDGFFHLLFNMLCLYWFGSMYGQLYDKREMLWLYILGALSGGVLYVLAYNIFPYFASTLPDSCLVGASGAIMAIVFAVAFRIPNYQVRLILVGPVRLKYLVLFLLIVDVLSLVGNNAGGHFAHLGGAFLGVVQYLVSQSRHTLLGPFVRLQEWCKWKIKKSSTATKRPERTYHRPVQTSTKKNAQAAKEAAIQMERILEKVKVSGYSSLTSQERDILFGNTKH